MHIADGILPASACLAAHCGAAAALWATARRDAGAEAVRMGMLAAGVFVASSVRFPVAGTSMHLGLYGLAGIMLGKRSFLVIWVCLLFQAMLLQQGGLLSLGVNALNMGCGALAAAVLWRLRFLPMGPRAFLCGFAGVMLPALLMATEFALAGYGRGFFWIAGAYSAVALIEAAATVFIVTTLRRVKPALLESRA
jgi:cobalt/nickel transport system permease protein